MASAASQVIVTTTAAATRAADNLSLPFLARPQAMTLYLRFVDMGTVVVPSVIRILTIGASAGSTPYFTVFGTGAGGYQTQYSNGFATSNAAVSGGVVGDSVELAASLSATGSAGLSISINGGAITTASAGTARALVTAWSDDVLWLNSVGTNMTGFVGFRNVEIVRGVFDLPTMRRKAGVTF